MLLRLRPRALQTPLRTIAAASAAVTAVEASSAVEATPVLRAVPPPPPLRPLRPLGSAELGRKAAAETEPAEAEAGRRAEERAAEGGLFLDQVSAFQDAIGTSGGASEKLPSVLPEFGTGPGIEALESTVWASGACTRSWQ